MRSMLAGLFPLLIVATWSAGSVLVDRACHQRAPAGQILAARLCVGFCFAAIAALAWAMARPDQNRSDAPMGRIVRQGPSALEAPISGRADRVAGEGAPQDQAPPPAPCAEGQACRDDHGLPPRLRDLAAHLRPAAGDGVASGTKAWNGRDTVRPE